MTAPDPAVTAQPRPKPENIWLNLMFNIAVPTLVLTKLSSESRLGPLGALLVGIAFPLGYGIYDLIKRQKWNLFSIVGLVSVSLTGGLGLMQVGSMGFAIKEATVPAIFAIAVLATLRTKKPLVREMMLNESVINVPVLEAAITARGTQAAFDRLLLTSTRLLAATLAGSAVVNFVLARIILTAPPGSTEFTAQIGRMTWVSFAAITAPFLVMMIFILMRLFKGIHALSGLTLEQVMHARHDEKTTSATLK
jgi:hypothetical protein